MQLPKSFEVVLLSSGELPEAGKMHITYNEINDHFNYMFFAENKEWYLAEFLAKEHPDKNIPGVVAFLRPSTSLPDAAQGEKSIDEIKAMAREFADIPINININEMGPYKSGVRVGYLRGYQTAVNEISSPQQSGTGAMRWVKASERNPTEQGYYYSYAHEGKVYKQMAFWYAADQEWSTGVFEWLDESAALTQSPVAATIDRDMAGKIWDAAEQHTSQKFFDYSEKQESVSAPDKETFINSLTTFK